MLSYNPQFGPALAGYLVIKTKDAHDGADAISSLLGNNTYYSDSLADGYEAAGLFAQALTQQTQAVKLARQQKSIYLQQYRERLKKLEEKIKEKGLLKQG